MMKNKYKKKKPRICSRLKEPAGANCSRRQAVSGGTLKLLLPVHTVCPLCQGTGLIGFWDCQRCASAGVIDTELPLLVSYPGGIKNTFNKRISLTRYGIDNFYLTVRIRVDN